MRGAHRLVRFVDRDQGLILPRGNPAGIRSLRDVAANGMRFINRQRGSGTRLLIDQMIADEGIDPRSLDGYGKEEFTHPAVAATVASGGADAGIGLRAAAAEYDLAFVPLVRERYFLAVRVKDLESPAVVRLLEVLRSPAIRARCAQPPRLPRDGRGDRRDAGSAGRNRARARAPARADSLSDLDEALAPGARHERDALEQVHVLLVLEQRAVQRRDQHLLVGALQRLGRNVLGEQQLQPVEELGGRRLLLQARARRAG